jgi:hypothetical protein
MKPVFEFFKSIVDWVIDKIHKEGVYRTFMAIMMTIIMIAFLSGYADRIIHGVGQEIDEDRTEQFEHHQSLWMESRELYATVKSIMRSERAYTNADYILFLDYHNGSENISTGYQYCKFDVSISVRSDTVPVLPVEDFKDETIWKWDMLLTDAVMNHKMTEVTLDEAFKIDPGMVGRIHPNEHTQFIVFYNITINNICAGTMMFMYPNKESVDYGAVATCGNHVETVIVNALKERTLAKQKNKK